MRHRLIAICTSVSLALAATVALPASANTFTIGASGFSAWNFSIDGAPAVPNPELTLYTGQTYTFTVSASGTHPFWIKTVQGNGSANGYAGGGLSANGVTSNTSITFTPPNDAPSTLFYNCGNHGAMTGIINIVVDPIFKSDFE